MLLVGVGCRTTPPPRPSDQLPPLSTPLPLSDAAARTYTSSLDSSVRADAIPAAVRDRRMFFTIKDERMSHPVHPQEGEEEEELIDSTVCKLYSAGKLGIRLKSVTKKTKRHHIYTKIR